MNIEIREFTKEDWLAWAGAERFENGQNPLIYTHNKGGEVTILGDKNGVEVIIIVDTPDESMEGYSWDYKKELTPLQAEGEMRALIKLLNLEENPHLADIAYTLDHTNAYKFTNFDW